MPLGREKVWLATPSTATNPATRTRRDARLEDYADTSWITPPIGLTCREMVQRACGLAGFRPQMAAESVDYSVQLALVAAGVGVAPIRELAIDALLAAVELRDLTTHVGRHIHVSQRQARRAEPGLTTLIGLVTSTAGKHLSTTQISRR